MKHIIRLFILFLCAYSINAQPPKVSINAQPEKIEIKKNEKTTIRIQVKLPSPWHTYDVNEQIGADGIGPSTTLISFEPEGLLIIDGKIKTSKPQKKYDKEFGMDVAYFKKSFEFIVPVKANKDIDFTKDKLLTLLDMQLCNETTCLPPDYYKGTISSTSYINDEVIVDESDVETTEQIIASINEEITPNSQTETIQKTDSQAEIDRKMEEGIWSFLWFAMIAGALSLLTPCVYPMIPITVSFFTKRAEKEKSNSVRDASVYAIGIMLTFTGLGVLLATIFGATGVRDIASSGWINLFVTAIFIIFALSLFGAFEIQLPSGIMNKLNQKSNQGTGIISILLMALTFTLTSFACTAPFVGAALVAASDGEWFYPIIGMLGFSGVLAAPFFFLALFPAAMKKMPKSGGWMNNVKVVMGFIVIAAAFKFLSNADVAWDLGLLSKELFLAIWITLCFLIVLYILGIFRFNHDSKVDGINASRILWTILFGTLAFYFLTGLFGKSLGELDAFLPATEMSAAITLEQSTSSATAKLEWLDNYDEGLTLAKQTGKPIFLDFTGFTCTNCKWMERNMFTKTEINSLLNEFVKVKLYTDKREEPYISNKKLQETQYNSIELPLYVIISPDGKFIGTKAFTRDENEFIAFLNKGIERKK